MCAPDAASIDTRQAELAKAAQPILARNRILEAWLQTATPDELTRVWGPPATDRDGQDRWRIATEVVPYLTDERFERDGMHCGLLVQSSWVWMVEFVGDARFVRRVVGHSASTPRVIDLPGEVGTDFR